MLQARRGPLGGQPGTVVQRAQQRQHHPVGGQGLAQPFPRPVADGPLRAVRVAPFGGDDDFRLAGQGAQAGHGLHAIAVGQGGGQEDHVGASGQQTAFGQAARTRGPVPQPLCNARHQLG